MEDLPEDNNFFISLPYFGLQSEKLKLQLTSLLNKYFENIKFKILLVNKQTIGELFQYKDTLDKGIFSYQRTFPFLWWSSGLPVSI